MVNRQIPEDLHPILRVGMIAGASVAAVSLGLFLGGNHEERVVGCGGCAAVYAAGQWWALQRLG